MLRVGNRLRSALGLGAVFALVSLTALGVPGASATHESCLGQTATVVGTEEDDVIEGTEGDDVILALGGADSIHGLEGDDLVCGGAGDDMVYGDAGTDHLDGGPDADYCDYTDEDGLTEGQETYSDECEEVF